MTRHDWLDVDGLRHGLFYSIFMSVGYKHDITHLWLQCILFRYILLERHVHQLSEVQQIQLFLGQHKVHVDVHTW